MEFLAVTLNIIHPKYLESPKQHIAYFISCKQLALNMTIHFKNNNSAKKEERYFYSVCQESCELAYLHGEMSFNKIIRFWKYR